MSVKERIIEYIKYKGISNSEFCRTIGVSTAFISSMVRSIQPDKILSIALKYPDLNTGWLMTGEGEMLKSGMVDASDPNIKNLKFTLEEIGEAQDRAMAKLIRDKVLYQSEVVDALTELKNQLKSENEFLKSENKRLQGIISELIKEK